MTRPVVAKVEFHYGELFPSGFIVTNLGTSSREVVEPCKGKPFDVTNQLELKGSKRKSRFRTRNLSALIGLFDRVETSESNRKQIEQIDATMKNEIPVDKSS